MKRAVKAVFIDELGIDDEAYSEDLVYNSIPEWDSASHMVIVEALEEKFGIELNSDEVVSMTTIPKIYAVLESKGIPVES
jgi:acyl carrier protein